HCHRALRVVGPGLRDGDGGAPLPARLRVARSPPRRPLVLRDQRARSRPLHARRLSHRGPASRSRLHRRPLGRRAHPRAPRRRAAMLIATVASMGALAMALAAATPRTRPSALPPNTAPAYAATFSQSLEHRVAGRPEILHATVRIRSDGGTHTRWDSEREGQT